MTRRIQLDLTACSHFGWLGALTVADPERCATPDFRSDHALDEMFVVLWGNDTADFATGGESGKAEQMAFIASGADYRHQIINTSDTPLKCMSVSTREQTEICEFYVPGKLLAALREEKASGESIEVLKRRRVAFYDYLVGIDGEFLKKGKPVNFDDGEQYGGRNDYSGDNSDVAEQMQALGGHLGAAIRRIPRSASRRGTISPSERSITDAA